TGVDRADRLSAGAGVPPGAPRARLRGSSDRRGPPGRRGLHSLGGRALLSVRAGHLAGQLILQRRHIRVHHQLNELSEAHLGLPAQLLLRLARVPEEMVDLRGPVVLRIDLDVLVWIETPASKGDL